ncbi:DUF2975 domain-containing protein [Chitinophagaceae bacterium 26-R-25]|nr:DUF2975 domain-containing protein [Chitinophagaceae bacterium 26-R-25]
MKTRTENILTVMNILAWVAFVGLMIKAGAILVSFGVSCVNPEAARNLYKGMNLYNLEQYSMAHYTLSVLFKVAIIIMESYTAYQVIKVLSKIKLVNPFNMEISNALEKISYFILGIWVTAMVYNVHVGWLMKNVTGLQENFIPGDFIFMAGVVFVIAQIFKKGVEIQAENELTV